MEDVEQVPHFDHDAPRPNARVRKKKLQYALEREGARAIYAAGNIEGKRVAVALRLGLAGGLILNTSAVFTSLRNSRGFIKKVFLDGKRTRLHKIASISSTELPVH